MDQVIDFFKGLFDTDLWPARWVCGYWSDFQGWLYIGSDLTIWFSYFAIPVIILGYVVRKKYEVKYMKTYLLFIGFILLCGSTHLMDVMMFWIPMYRMNSLLHFLTGAISLLTVIHLVQILPEAFRDKTSLMLEKEIAKRLVVEQQLAKANEGLEAFAWMASHDLKEPLRTINFYTNKLYESNKTHLNEESQRYVEKTLAANGRMRRMIEDILSLSTLSKEPDLKETDLNEVLNQVLLDLDLQIDSTAAMIEVGDLPKVKGHHEYLVLMFTNLISNSLKFTKGQPVVKITAQAKGDKVILSVADNGIGMDSTQMEKLFTPFERLHSKAEYEGSGLGLAIVKRVVEIHKGEVSVNSTVGEGSTFTITLERK